MMRACIKFAYEARLLHKRNVIDEKAHFFISYKARFLKTIHLILHLKRACFFNDRIRVCCALATYLLWH